MANDLQRVGLVFTAEGTVDFKKSIQEVNGSIQENRSAFKLAQSQWDENTKTVDKLRERQEYLSKQTKDYTDKVALLQGELKELEQREKTNTEKIQKKREQLEAARNTTEGYKQKCDALKAELEALENAEGNNEKAIEKKQKQIAAAEKAFLDYSGKVEKLEQDIEKLNKKESNHTTAVQKKRTQLQDTQTALNNYRNALEDVEHDLKTGAYKLREYTEKLENFKEKADGISDTLSGVSGAAGGLLAGAAAMVPATEEYRKIMASLESSSQLAGYTAEQTKESYNQLFEVLGDDQTAATTTANLQALGLSQEQMTELINGTIGAWAKYGDSIPIDGLAEAINETVKSGQVTGNLADVLNWGTKENENFGITLKENIDFTELSSEKLKKLSETEREEYETKKAQYEAIQEYNQKVEEAISGEDRFNLALEEAGTEAERMDMILKLLSEQGLTEVGEQWKENNENLTEGNRATADMKEATAELAETIAPIITELTSFMAELLGKFNDLPESVQGAIGVALGLISVSSTLFSTIGKVSGGIEALTGFIGKSDRATSFFTSAFSKLGDGANAVWGIMSAHPLGAFITILGVVITTVVTMYNKFEWFRNGVDNIFGSVADFMEEVGETLRNIFDFNWELPKIKLPHFNITGEFSLSPPNIPKFSVSWYAKGGILNHPTIFGMNGDNFLGGGEAGPEAVLPIEMLRRYIREENNANNSILVAAIKEALSELHITAENNIYIGDKKLMNTITEMVVKRISGSVKDSMRVQGTW